MTLEAILIWIIVGGLAGFLAGIIVRGYGLGLAGNVVVGIIGAFVAGWLLPTLGIGIALGNPLLTAILYATIGAVVFLLLIGVVRRTA